MKTALILNFTGNEYHYGCYGTSYEIYHQLIEKGYAVNYITARLTRSVVTPPKSRDDFSDVDFIQHFMKKENASVFLSMQEADIIVVNGEGTLYNFSKGSLTLLLLIHLAKAIYSKPIYLINHSLYPTQEELANSQTPLYSAVLKDLAAIVPRDPLSAENYKQLKLPYKQGFDSLPLYIRRTGLDKHRDNKLNNGNIVLCGGISYKDAKLHIIADVLKNYSDERFSFSG